MDRSFLFTAWGLSWIFYAQSNPLHAPSSISIFFICSAAWLSEKIHKSRSGETTMKRKGSCFTNLTNGMLRKISYAERVLVGSKIPPARGTQRRFPPKHTENTIYFRYLEMYSKQRYKICICSAILDELESFRSKLQGLVMSIQYFPENFRCNLK